MNYFQFLIKAGLANTRNDGPAFSFIPPEDTVKITMDLSDNGPVFSALDQMMLQMIDDGAADRKSKGADEAKNALKNLLRSGIPGIEGMFAGPDDGAQKPMKKVRFSAVLLKSV